MKKTFVRIIKILVIIYIGICGLLFIFQEKLIFFPEKLKKEYRFGFIQDFEELGIKTNDNVLLNGILFKADSSKGLIFYLHGNAGSLKSWDNWQKTIQTYITIFLFWITGDLVRAADLSGVRSS